MKKSVRVEVVKGPNENPISVIKRFTKKVSGSGVLRKVRSIRYKERPLSTLKKKQQAIRRMTRRDEREVLFKLGKLENVVKHRR